MLIHFDDPISLTGAYAINHPVILYYGIHHTLELECVAGLENVPVDLQSQGCTKWVLRLTKSLETPEAVIAEAVFMDNIFDFNKGVFDFAVTSVEAYKYIAGNASTAAILTLTGAQDEESVPSVIIQLPVILKSACTDKLPTDLSTALMQEVQLGAAIAGAAAERSSRILDQVSQMEGSLDADIIAAKQASHEATQAAANATVLVDEALDDVATATQSATNAAISESHAKASENNAAQSAAYANSSKLAAAGYADDALGAASTATQKARDASDAASVANGYRASAADSAASALGYRDAASASAREASQSELNASNSASNAHSSETSASESAASALDSKNRAAGSATAAGNSEVAAAGSATAASNSAVLARSYSDGDTHTRAGEETDNSKYYKEQAATARDQAQAADASAQAFSGAASESSVNASNQASSAASSAQIVTNAASTASNDAQTVASYLAQSLVAKDSALNSKAAAEASATLSTSYAIGGTNTRTGEDTDNAKYYKEQAEQAASDVSSTADAAAAWAEGTDEQVEVLGGEHSAKTYATQSQVIYNSFLEQVHHMVVGPAFGYGVTTDGLNVSITWADPADESYALWHHTRLLYKYGDYPANENDGTLLIDSTVRNQFQYTPFTFTADTLDGLCFALFTCTTTGAWNTGSASPKFLPSDVTWGTIAMMTRSNTLLGSMGITYGSVVDIPVNNRYSAMRYMLVDVNYKGDFETCSEFHYDHTRNFNSIWIPRYLPCPSNTNTAEQMQFDAPELSYAATWDATFLTGKAYYKLVSGEYVQLVAGTDYTNGDSIQEWSTTEGITVYAKNHASRASSGSNRYLQANMRIWMQSTGQSWWTPQNEYDQLSGSNGYAWGWLEGFDQGFLDLIMPVYNKTARNTTAETSGGAGGGYDITLDKFWLPSLTEVYGSANNGINEGRQFAYFRDVATTNAQRIQRDEGGTARYCFLRSPNAGSVYTEYYITTSGASSATSLASSAYAFLPAICIA